MTNEEAKKRSVLDTPLSRWFPPTLETLIVVLIIILALFSRFYDLGARVMSHDEINHVVPSYDFYQGRGYHYDPISHGPLQFHLIAFSYFMFGDSDFTSRIPAAVFSVAIIVFAMIAFRRYLGRAGSLIAGVLFLISPYMLFYGRYARNEVFIVLWGIVTLYSILRYLERGETAALILFTVVNAFHFVDKATSYIFAAEELLFLSLYFVIQIARRKWRNPRQRGQFLALLAIAVVFLALGFIAYQAGHPTSAVSAVEEPADMSVIPSGQQNSVFTVFAVLGVASALICVFGGLFLLVKGLGWRAIRDERSFDLIVLLGSIILPLLAALPIKLIGFDPLDTSREGIIRSAAFVLPLIVIGVAIGFWWKPKVWLICSALFYAIFIFFYSTMLTYPEGVAVGWMAALGYWSGQQVVNRGEQPWFYYVFIQIPMYEYLPALGTLLAALVGFRRKLWSALPDQPFVPIEIDTDSNEDISIELGEDTAIQQPSLRSVPTLALFLFWSVSSLLAFTIAGEKMPWLTIHIALPLILSTAWFLGYLIDKINWSDMAELWQFNIKGRYQFGGILLIAIFILLGIQTVRTAFRAAFINYDYPTEYLVYAHAARDPKFILSQIEDISRRTTGGLDIDVAYDNDCRYPYWWYLRHYPNRKDYDATPTRSLRDSAIVLVGAANYAKVEAMLKDDFLEYNYMRLWWPNQDYLNLKWKQIEVERSNEQIAGQHPLAPMTIGEYIRRVWKHIQPYITDPKYRHAAWQVWFNRNYSEIAELQGSSTYTLENWEPSNRMRMYLRKDIAAKVWGGDAEISGEITGDVYKDKITSINADRLNGAPGTEPGQFQAPHGLAIAADGSLFIADGRNNRIQHVNIDGQVIKVWGSFADVSTGEAPAGTFNEPWGIAVAPDGSVYVTDTWNHRVQKFSSDGQPLAMWGAFGQGDSSDAFWGPRGIAVDSRGRVYVADTGNKRIVVYGKDGKYITQFGTVGSEPGQFDEPVGVAVGKDGFVYVTDTWNQRIQVFSPDMGGDINFTPYAQWDISAWYGQSLDNKPFIAVSNDRRVYVTDPEGYRILEFSSSGEVLRVWETIGAGSAFASLPSGIAVDANGGIWVSDAAANVIRHYTLPE